MVSALHLLLAAALAASPAASVRNQEVQQVGIWHIVASGGDCTALYKFGETDLLVALIYPQPGTKKDAALMFTSERQFFGDAQDRAPYPARLVLTNDSDFDTSWHEVVPTGMILRGGTHGIRIAAPVAAFTDSLAKAEALRLEGIGRGTINLEVHDMRAMVDALRKCVAAPR